MNTENNDSDNQEVTTITDSTDHEEETKKNIHSHKKSCKNIRTNKSDHEEKDKLDVEVNKHVLSGKENETANKPVQTENGNIQKVPKDKHVHDQQTKRELDHDCIKRYASLDLVINTNIDKIVPICLRRRCDRLIRTKDRDCKRRKTINRLRSYSRRFQETKQEDYYRKHSNSSNHKSRNTSILSPISPVSLSGDAEIQENTYAHGSLESLPFVTDKLDMLIKRTKEREKKLQEKTTNIQQALEPITANDMESEDDCPTIYNNAMDVSLDSVASLIIKSRHSSPRNQLNPDDNIRMRKGYLSQHPTTNSAATGSGLLVRGKDT